MIGQMERTGDWTEGEWRVVRGVNDISVVDIDRTVIAEIAGRGPVNTNEPLANARLIAAAPELHAALEALLPEGWGDDDTMDHMRGVKQARLALAKVQST